MTQFVSQNLSSQLWEESEKITKYANFVYQHTTDTCIKSIMGRFIGMPCDGFRRLIEFLTFQEVVVLLHQGKIDKANLLTNKYDKFSKLFWNGPRNLIESGRLLSSGK